MILLDGVMKIKLLILLFLIPLFSGVLKAQTKEALVDSTTKYNELYNWYWLYAPDPYKADSIMRKCNYYSDKIDSIARANEKKRLELKYHLKLK